MVIKGTYDLKSLSTQRFDTEYIHNAKTSKSMYIAKILVLGLAVGGMLFTSTMAKRIVKNKIDTITVLKKKESKKETNGSQRDCNDSDMSSSSENAEQLLENPSNMKPLNMDQGVDMNTGGSMLEKTHTCREDIGDAETVNSSMYEVDIQRNKTAVKDYCTSKSIKELISLIEDAVKT